jgi:hypothetical protein
MAKRVVPARHGTSTIRHDTSSTTLCRARAYPCRATSGYRAKVEALARPYEISGVSCRAALRGTIVLQENGANQDANVKKNITQIIKNLTYKSN